MTLIAGLGSPHGDDQVGWVAIDRLRPRLPAGIIARKFRDGIDLLEFLDGQDTAIVIDAVEPAGQPGTVRSFQWPCPELALRFNLSTHGLSLVEALHLAESLGRLPRRLNIHTIEAKDNSPGAPMTPEIARSLDTLVDCIVDDVNRPERD
jgi:hydrogenase maturation protease